MSEKISGDVIFNAVVQMYLNFDERMGKPKIKGLPDAASPAYKTAYAEAVAADFAEFYKVFTTSLAERLRSDK